MYDMLAVTCNGHVWPEFKRKEAVKAHILQFSLLWILDLSYRKAPEKGKGQTKRFVYYFDFVCNIFWGFPPRYKVFHITTHLELTSKEMGHII